MVAKGTKMSEESRLKMRLAKLGKKQSPELIEARRQGLLGRTLLLEHRRRISRSLGGGGLEIKGDYAYRSGCVDHPLAEAGRIAEHRWVLYDEIGPGPHYCEVMFACDGAQPLEWEGKFGINVDHIDRDTLNNERSNLRVACWHCNRNRDNPWHQIHQGVQ